MDQNLLNLRTAQIESLGETIDALIKHRESITDNTEDYGSTSVGELIEAVDASIITAIEGIIYLEDKEPIKKGGSITA